jgi:N-acetylglucosamine kinase-like BadF-type ATPase
MRPSWVTVGIDAGGTWLRVTVGDLDGRPLRRLVAACGRKSRTTNFDDIVARAVREVVEQDRVIAAAGSNAHGLNAAWRTARMGGPPLMLMSEAVLACHPGDTSAVVLIAGTGSAAATIEYGRETLVTGACGIWNDVGGGVWIGQHALEAVKAARDGTGPATALTAMFTHQRRAQLLNTPHDQLPYRDVGMLARLVTTAAHNGDQVARDICEQAATQLTSLLDGHDLAGHAHGQVLTVGSVASPTTMVGQALARQLPKGVTTKHVGDLDQAAVRWAASTLDGRARPDDW